MTSNVTLPLSCGQPAAKCTALHSFGPLLPGREGWVMGVGVGAQSVRHLHTYCPCSVHRSGHSTKQCNQDTRLHLREISCNWKTCVLVPSLFGIFPLILSYVFRACHDGIYSSTKCGGKIFNLLHLRAIPQMRQVPVQEILFEKDAELRV